MKISSYLSEDKNKDMKKNVIITTTALIFGVLLLFKALVSEITPNGNFISCNTDSISYVDALPRNFDYAYSRFKVFNPDIDSSTVIKFNTVCEVYRLDTTESLLKWCVGQILLESGAKQYYQTGHPKEGQLVVSHGGAIGFSQIMPNTAYGNLKKYVTDEDAKEMYALGCTSFEFIKTDTDKSKLVNMTKKWLENETNNIVLWGFIMRKKMRTTTDIYRVLVSYNAGTGGMNNYIESGGSLANHHYVLGIKRKLNYAEDSVSDL